MGFLLGFLLARPVWSGLFGDSAGDARTLIGADYFIPGAT
jgi:hypothetical protein